MLGQGEGAAAPTDILRLICYSVSPPADGRVAARLTSQLLASARTLRAHNSDLPVRVYWRGAIDPGTEKALAALQVEVSRTPSYRELMNQTVGADVLSLYPVLHKYFIFESLVTERTPHQVLLLDCDTLFLNDVQYLFDRYQDSDIVACPEVGSRRRERGYDPAYLDEDAIARAAESLGGRFIAPFNSGVLLLSARSVEVLAQLRQLILDLALRLMVGIVRGSAAPRSIALHRLRRRLADSPAEFEGVDPVHFPSSNPWIVEEVALWLALGLSQDLKVTDFRGTDVALGDDVYAAPIESTAWTLGHYFTANFAETRQWWERAQGGETGKKRHWRSQSHAIDIDPALLDSPLVADHGGFLVFDSLLDDNTLAAIRGEARDAYWSGQEQYLAARFGDDGRGSHPPRRLVSSGGGPVQDEAYQSDRLRQMLERLCRLDVEPTGRRGTLNYYTREGDYMGLHLDVEECELVVLTLLQDASHPDDLRGAYELFPDHIGRGLSTIPVGSHARRVVLNVRPGQSVVMFGGLVPHRVRPVGPGQGRVVSALCFRAPAASGTAAAS